MINFYVDAWKKFAAFGGRSRRKEFWIFWLVNAVISSVLQAVAGPLGMAGMIVLGIFGLAILLPMIAVGIRRMHDIGRSGWWVSVNLIPVIGSLWFIVLAAKDSEAGGNAWGACPK